MSESAVATISGVTYKMQYQKTAWALSIDQREIKLYYDTMKTIWSVALYLIISFKCAKSIFLKSLIKLIRSCRILENVSAWLVVG